MDLILLANTASKAMAALAVNFRNIIACSVRATLSSAASQWTYHLYQWDPRGKWIGLPRVHR